MVFGADVRPALEEGVEQAGGTVVIGSLRGVTGRIAGRLPHHAELHELRETVVYVHPQAAERRHQRFDLERFVRPRAQESKQPGAQGRLDEVSETRLQVGRPVRTSKGSRTPGESKGQIVHGNRQKLVL